MWLKWLVCVALALTNLLLRWLVWRDWSRYTSKYRPKDILQNLMSGVFYYKALNLCRSNSSCFFFVLKAMTSVVATLINSLCHMKSTASVTENSHQGRCRCYLHLPIFLLIHTVSSSTGKWKVVLIFFFLSKLEHRPLFNDIYCKTILMWGLV